MPRSRHSRAMREMQRRGCRDADRVDLAEQLAKIGSRLTPGFGGDFLARLFAGVDDCHQFGAGQCDILLGVKSAEVTDADNGCPYFLHDDFRACPAIHDDTQWRLLRRVRLILHDPANDSSFRQVLADHRAGLRRARAAVAGFRDGSDAAGAVHGRQRPQFFVNFLLDLVTLSLARLGARARVRC